jgi:transaldolase
VNAVGVRCAASLQGKAAIANAKLAYASFQEMFGGPRFQSLKAKGARVQRPLWASTGTKNKAYSEVMYVDELIGPDTVNTVPPATLAACPIRAKAAGPSSLPSTRAHPCRV